MQAQIRALSEKKMVGINRRMSLLQNTTGLLWREFQINRNKINHTISKDLYSIQIYPADYYSPFNPAREFEKWAAIEVSNHEQIPEGMQSFLMPAGLYAVFLHKGAASTASATFQYIFTTWLPASGYQLDHRPHFEILGKNYKNDHPDSEEEIWIPIR